MAFVGVPFTTFENSTALLSGSEGGSDVRVTVTGNASPENNQIITPPLGLRIGKGPSGDRSNDDPTFTFSRPVTELLVNIRATNGYIDPETNDYVLSPSLTRFEGEEYAILVNGEKLTPEELTVVLNDNEPFSPASRGWEVNAAGNLIKPNNDPFVTTRFDFRDLADGISTFQFDTIHNVAREDADLASLSVVSVSVETRPFIRAEDAIEGTSDDDFLQGTAGADSILGGSGWDTLIGEGGDDFLDGSRGNDLLIGGPGNDTLYSGYGADQVEGGAGDDLLFVTAGDTLIGGAGDDTFVVDPKAFKLIGHSITIHGDYGIDAAGEPAGYDTLDLNGYLLETFSPDGGDPNSGSGTIRFEGFETPRSSGFTIQYDGIENIIGLRGNNPGVVDTSQDSTISGNAFFDFDGNDVEDTGDDAIANVNVSLFRDDELVDQKATDANGEYSFEGLEAGEYTVFFARPAGLDFVNLLDPNGNGTQASDSDANSFGAAEVHLGISQDIINIDVGFSSPEIDTPIDGGGNSSAISGTVFLDADSDDVESDGDGVLENVTVSLFRDDEMVAQTDTAADGTYNFDGLEAGEYAVLFAKPENTEFVALQDPNSNGSEETNSDANQWGAAEVHLNGSDRATHIDAGLTRSVIRQDVAELPGEDLMAILLTPIEDEYVVLDPEDEEALEPEALLLV